MSDTYDINTEPPFGVRLLLWNQYGHHVVWTGKRWYDPADGDGSLQTQEAWPPWDYGGENAIWQAGTVQPPIPPRPHRRRPRVSYCALTNVWIVNPYGWRHHCGTLTAYHDVAFRRWEVALNFANDIMHTRTNSA